MNIIQRLFGRKDSQARIALSFRQVGNPLTTPRNYEGFSKEGYQKNVTVFRCVSMIAKACGGIAWELYQNRRGGEPMEIEEHDLLTLMSRPNPMQGRASFFEYFIGYYMLTGNTFIESVRPSMNKPPMELWPVRPDKMKIEPGPKGYPGRYILQNGEMIRQWPVNPVTLQSDMFHMKSFHPLNDWWGMSPLEASLYALDQNNHGQRWNLALLQNSATPSGVLQMKTTDVNPAGSLNEEQFARLRSEVETEFSGAKNAGRPLILEGGMEWKQISMSPKDMEFLKAKEVTAIDICQAFGVPPEMLGLGQKTYSNYEEARMSFYEDTVLPLMDMVETELNNWLIPMFGADLKLCYDKDDIEALAPKREKKFTSMQNANWLMVNEKRVATGYEPVKGWDVFIIGNQIMSDPMEGATDATDDSNGSTEEPGTAPQEDETPTPDETAQNNATQQNDGTDPQAEGEGAKGWKNFNLLNRNEKRASWRKQNSRRKGLENSFRRDLESDFKEMVRDMKSAVRGKTESRVIEFALLKVMDDHMPVIKKTLQRHIKYTVEDFADVVFNEAKSIWPGIETKATRQWEDWADRYVKKRTGEAIGQIEGTTKKQVQRVVKRAVEQALQDGNSNTEVANDLMNEFDGITKSRAMLIARTEVASASNNASINAVRSLQVPNMVKEWVSSEDDRVRDGGKDGHGADHESMDGVSVELDDMFSVPPDATMEGPGDMSGGPDQVCNCRCVLVFKSNNRNED